MRKVVIIGRYIPRFDTKIDELIVEGDAIVLIPNGYPYTPKVKCRGNGTFVSEVKNLQVEVYDNATAIVTDCTVHAHQNAFVVAKGDSYVDTWQNAVVIAKDTTSVQAFENSKVVAEDSAYVNTYRDSTAYVEDEARVIAENNSKAIGNEERLLEVKDSATLIYKDRFETTNATISGLHGYTMNNA